MIGFAALLCPVDGITSSAPVLDSRNCYDVFKYPATAGQSLPTFFTVVSIFFGIVLIFG